MLMLITSAAALAEVISGSCGENVTYSLDLETGALTIKGSGEMEAFSEKYISGNYRTTAPWGEYYDKISSVIIEDGVTNISREAFCGCSNISSIEISNTVKTIDGYAFHICSNLNSIAIPASVTNIHNNAFYGCSISAINVASNNNSYSSIDGVLFSKDKSTLIVYPEYRAGDSYEIPNTVTTIGHEAFRGASLTSVSIPNSVSSIESLAFQSCRLKSVNIPYSVTFIGYRAFVGCYSLTSINVENGNNYYCSADGVLFDKNKTELVQYPINKEGSIYEIPNSVTNIGDFAFQNCSNLPSIVIPDSVTNIGNCAFYYCENLSSVSIGKSVANIGNHAFSGNEKISEITLYPTTPPTVYNSYIFSNDVYNTAKLIVPGESYEEYKQHETWGKFNNIEYTSSFRMFTNENEMAVGESQMLQVKCTPDMANESISWNSSDSSIITVENGVVTAKAVGTATITATCGGFVSECTITVVDKKELEIVFGYCDDHVGGGVGNGTDKPIKCAIRIPASVLNNYKGCSITRIDVGVSDNVTQLVPVISTGGEENHATQAGRNGISGWNELELASPYAIGGDKDLYVGYQCVGTYAAGLSNIKSKYGSYISLGNEWEDYSDSDWGSFCIRVHIKGFDLPIDVVLTSDQIIECEAGQTVYLQSNVQNLSPEKINSLKLGYYIDNEYKGSKELTLDIEKGNIVPVSIPVTAPASSGIYNVKVEVESVNGKNDEVAANNTATIPLTIAGKTYDRKVVIEEITGTWCGWCIRGYVGMKEMAEKYPDNFIGIAVHGSDEMAGAINYNNIHDLLGTSYPACIANRNIKYKSGASPYDMEQAILALKDKALAEIKAEMYVLDADTTELMIKTHTEFGMNTSAPFRIAYVVVENGVGPYAQSNYYSGYTSMGGFENEGEYVALTFNDVARGIYGSYNGVAGSVPASVNEGQVYDYEYRLRMPSNVDCKSNVEVVTLLINQTTGEIMNAYKCSFDENADAIDSIDSVINQQVEVYSLGGIKQNTPRRGVNIVRMSDGTVKKVMVK